MKKRSGYLVIIALCCITVGTRAQPFADTLVVTPPEAEVVFLQRNLRLLAAKLDIEVAKAEVIQSKLWPNPTVSIGEVNLWSNQGAEALGRLFGNWGNHAQVAVDVEQLIQTAGKRKKLVAVEETGIALAERSFEDLLRSLQVEFRTQLAELNRTQQGMAAYRQALERLQQLLTGYQRQVAQGNISRSEYMRLRASELELMKTIDDYRRQNGEAQQALKVLMGLSSADDRVLIATGFREIPFDTLKALNAATIQEWTYAYNTELAALRLGVTRADQQLRFERAQRVPDVKLSAGYDRGGNIMRDFVGLGIAVDLPLFHRNQGAIKAAQLALEQRRLLATNAENQVVGEAVRAWKDLQATVARRNLVGPQYEADMDALLEGYHRNFAQRHISLLEYLDFLDAYLQTKDNLLDIEKTLREQYETLRYHVGSQLP